MSDEYVMGIDPYGYDNITGTFCVMKKDEAGITVVAQYQSRNKEYFDKKIQEVMKYYNIPEDNILRLVNH